MERGYNDLSEAIGKEQALSDSGGKALYGIANLASDVAAHTSGLTEKQVRDVLKTAFGTIRSRLASKERVSIANFGAWRPTERVSRTNRNIRIGPMIPKSRPAAR